MPFSFGTFSFTFARKIGPPERSALRQNAVGPADPVQTLRRDRISTWPVTPNAASSLHRFLRHLFVPLFSYRYSLPTRLTAVAEALKHRAKHPGHVVTR